MADTGFKTAATEISDSWTSNMSPATLATSDNSRALATNTSYLGAVVEDFTFGIPAGSTVDGIEIAAEFSASFAGVVASLELSLSWDNGSNFTAVKEDTVTGNTDTTKTFGGATDTWGRAWSPDTEMVDGTFQVKVRGKAGTAGQSCRLDYMAIKVYYTLGGVMWVTIF